MKNSQITVGMPCEVLGGLTGYKADTYYIQTDRIVVMKDVKELDRYYYYGDIKETQVTLVLEDGTTLTGVHTLSHSLRDNTRYVLVARREGDKLVAFETVTKARLVPSGTKTRREAEEKSAKDVRDRRTWEQGLELQHQATYIMEHLPESVLNDLSAQYVLQDAAEGPTRYHDGSVNILRYDDASRVNDLYFVVKHLMTKQEAVSA